MPLIRYDPYTTLGGMSETAFRKIVHAGETQFKIALLRATAPTRNPNHQELLHVLHHPYCNDHDATPVLERIFTTLANDTSHGGHPSTPVVTSLTEHATFYPHWYTPEQLDTLANLYLELVPIPTITRDDIPLPDYGLPATVHRAAYMSARKTARYRSDRLSSGTVQTTTDLLFETLQFPAMISLMTATPRYVVEHGMKGLRGHVVTDSLGNPDWYRLLRDLAIAATAHPEWFTVQQMRELSTNYPRYTTLTKPDLTDDEAFDTLTYLTRKTHPYPLAHATDLLHNNPSPHLTNRSKAFVTLLV